MATKILKMSEQEFYNCTPRKLFCLADIHKKMNSYEEGQENGKESAEEVYIDNIIL